MTTMNWNCFLITYSRLKISRTSEPLKNVVGNQSFKMQILNLDISYQKNKLEAMDCLLCMIITGEVNSYKVYEDEDSIAILDLFPISPGHVLVMPKKHCRTLVEMEENDAANVFKTVVKIYKALANLTPNNDGFNVLQNNGKGAGQEVEHVHFHIIPRFKDDHVRFKFPKYTLLSAQLKFVQDKLIAVLKNSL